MAYGSLAGFKGWLGSQVSSTDPGQYEQITDKVAYTTASDTQGQLALDNASNLIDSYIGCKYTVPLTTAPGAIVESTYQIAAWNLVASHAGSSKEVKGRVQAMKDAAMEFIRDVAAGDACLVGTTITLSDSGGFVGGNEQIVLENELVV